MRNSTELRRFSFPHPSFFSEFLGSNDKGMATRAYIGREDPVAPGVGDRPPCIFFGQGPRCKFEEKKLHLGHVAPHRATGGSFEIFKNGHIFLKF